MARNKLSETRIRSLAKAGIYSDGDGLFLRVRSGGSKQWFFIFKRNGQRTEIGLGGYGQGTAPVPLLLAREKAEEIRQRLSRGEKLHRRKTFADIMDDVLDVKKASFRNDKHKDQWVMTLTKYAAALHKVPIADITRDHVVEVLKPIWTKIPETADRTRQRIAAVIDHAKARGLYTGDNPADWRGGLKELLPARSKLTRGHHAAVSYKELPGVLVKLQQSLAVSARAVEFIALTAARSNEARSMTWMEIDFTEKLWTIPAERMKAGKAHEVPLTDRAIQILKDQEAVRTSDLVFEGERVGRPISDTAMVKVFRAAGAGDATLHGLRSSLRDWAGDETDYPRDVAEAALAHTVKDKTEAAYRRGTALAKRRAMMDEWETYLYRSRD
ncbi:tyrosine-type recombinase/integrase [Pseudochrobactrum kiredjianiae]|uniref:Tyrosine-type recombinase/integrase n=1 Tax=Pseudochrobactrum kiredjianiae TaxID=386305 RepID=A0ABW3V0U5_9HYPH|nr:site-specific integrase [Pseudochrobactrum kiredjianiae]MDM7852645.1 tyrosine-type recombinase/integrase [Pseudochrobactrum kiredjianiae]